MDNYIDRLSTPEECEQLALNVADSDPSLAKRARRRGVEMRALAEGGNSDLEREAWKVIHAYEDVLTKRRGRKTPAQRTRNMIKDYGMIGAIERAVARKDDSSGYEALIECGMQDLTFESLVIRHKGSFDPAIIARCEERLSRYEHA